MTTETRTDKQKWPVSHDALRAALLDAAAASAAAGHPLDLATIAEDFALIGSHPRLAAQLEPDE